MFEKYNMNQQILPLDLEIQLQKNDIAFHIHHLVESIPPEVFAPFYQETGDVPKRRNEKVQAKSIEDEQLHIR